MLAHCCLNGLNTDLSVPRIEALASVRAARTEPATSRRRHGSGDRAGRERRRHCLLSRSIVISTPE
jgi:hypothetical protein